MRRRRQRAFAMLIYRSALYPLHLAGLLRIYYIHTIAEPSVLALSPATYLVGLTTACMNMYGLFKLIQL